MLTVQIDNHIDTFKNFDQTLNYNRGLIGSAHFCDNGHDGNNKAYSTARGCLSTTIIEPEHYNVVSLVNLHLVD